MAATLTYVSALDAASISVCGWVDLLVKNCWLKVTSSRGPSLGGLPPCLHILPREPELRPVGPSSSEETIKFFLQRSLYDFVLCHPNISLTDPRLTHWYLCLASNSRDVIQDEGGLYQFLQRHPGIELLSPHVCVTRNLGGHVAMPNRTYKQQTHVSTFQASYEEPRPPHCRQLNLTVATPPLPGTSASGPVEWWDPVRSLAGSPSQGCHQRGRPNRQISSVDGRCWTVSPEDLLVQCGRPLEDLQLQTEWYSLTGDQAKLTEDTDPSPGPEKVDTLTPVEENKDLNDDTAVPGSIMKDDDSIICVVPEGGKAQTGEAPSGSEAPVATSVVDPVVSTASKWTSCVPCVASCAVMVGAPLAMCSSTFTQTEDGATADELDRGDQARMRCDCVPRAQRAELSLLALQYHMCRRHCWTLQPPGDATHPPQTPPPAGIVATLQKLERDYNHMRDKILAGVHLRHLKPLSVDCDGTPSIPGAPSKPSTGLQIETARSRSAATRVSWDNAGGCKELNAGEVWYDAEEELGTTPSVEQPGEMSEGLVKKDITAPPSPSCNVTQVTTHPPLGRGVRLSSVVSSTPTPGATFVPPRFWTASGLDTVMAEVTRFHPHVGRKRIAAALKELWDTYQDALCPLPLSTITQMTSDVLTRPAHATPCTLEDAWIQPQ